MYSDISKKIFLLFKYIFWYYNYATICIKYHWQNFSYYKELRNNWCQSKPCNSGVYWRFWSKNVFSLTKGEIFSWIIFMKFITKNETFRLKKKVTGLRLYSLVLLISITTRCTLIMITGDNFLNYLQVRSVKTLPIGLYWPPGAISKQLWYV